MSHENTPKPKPPVSRPVPSHKKPEPIKEEKKPFIRKAHLTQRPFSESELLTQLRDRKEAR